MWLHPDGIARRIRWQTDDNGSHNWASAMKQACDAPQVDYAAVQANIQTMAVPMADARAQGIAEQFLASLQKTIERIRAQPEAL